MVLPALLTLSILAPVFYIIGRLCQHLLRLPAITGYIISGVVTGPHIIAILQQDTLNDLAYIEHMCLSYIAFLAGAELHLSGIKRIRKQVTTVTIGVSFFSWAFVYSCGLVASLKVPFLAALSRTELSAVCNLLGVLAIARSPASALAVMKEVRGSGPFCSLIMAVVVVKDVLVFLAFSLALNNAQQASLASSLPPNPLLSSVMDSLAGITSSILVGSVSGVILERSQRWLSHSKRFLYLRIPLPLLLSSLTYALSEYLHAEPLLACVATGAAAANLVRPTPHQQQTPTTPLGASSGSGSTTVFHHQSSHRISSNTTTTTTTTNSNSSSNSTSEGPNSALLPVVSAVLFGLVGAGLHVEKLVHNAGLAAVLFTVRIAGIWVGSWVGAMYGGVPLPQRGLIWQGMVTQAGIALGLTRVIVVRCTGASWGPDFEALMAGIVLGNVLLGPPLFRGAITAAGEAHGASGGSSSSFAAAIKQEEGLLMQEMVSTPKRAVRVLATIPIIDLSSSSAELVL